MRVRAAVATDLPVITQLVRALADYEELTHQLDGTDRKLGDLLFGADPAAQVLLAELDSGPVIGVAIWYPTFSTFTATTGIWVEDLFVLAEHRGKGAGTALLQRLFDLAGDGRVEWSVLNWNAPAIRFYESLGAKPVDDCAVYRWVRGD